MKNFMKKIMLLATVMSFTVGCGNNSSGGGGGNHAGPDLPGGGITSQSGQSVKSIEELRAIFEKKKMSDALEEGMPIFHMGPAFSNATVSSSLNFESSFCAQLLIWSFGDCKTQQQVYNEQYLAYINQSISNGRFNVVERLFSDSILVHQITEFFDASLDLQNSRGNADIYSKDNTPFYKEMLGLNTTNNWGFGGSSKYHVSSAKVEMENGQTIEAYLVEIFNYQTTSTAKKFIVSPQLAVIANPVAVIEPNYYGYTYFTGALKSVGGVKVKSISATTHVMNQNGQITQGQQIRF